MKIRTIIFGAAVTAVGLIVAYLLIRLTALGMRAYVNRFMIGESDLLIFSKDSVSVATEAATSLITTVTGYIVLVSSAVGYLYANKLFDLEKIRVGSMAVLALALISLYFLTLELAYLSDSARASWDHPNTLKKEVVESVNFHWNCSIVCFQIALSSFFASVTVTSTMVIALLAERRFGIQARA